MSASTQTLLAALSTLASDVRPASNEDAVAGVLPLVVATPTTESQVGEILAYANRAGLAVLPRGGGTQLGYGFPPRAGDILLDLSRLDAVTEYAPHDLTVSAQAGITLSSLQAVLAESRQMLALDPLLLAGATLGGIISTNASGPRRLRFGGVRDQLIGVRVALPDGTIAKGGGKVVKNVAGYDLPKLYTGALGTLGVILAATFRVYPLPNATMTVEVPAPSPAPLCELVQQILHSPVVPTAMDVLSGAPAEAEARACTLAVRFESGVGAAARDQARTVGDWAHKAGLEFRTLAGADEAELWRATPPQPLLPPSQAPTLSLKASVLPSDVARWLDSLISQQARRGLRSVWRAHAGHGLIEAQIEGPAEALVEAVANLREDAVARQGSLVVTSAPNDLLVRLDPWGPVPALDVMRALKQNFDPNGILNPGRYVGGL